MRAKNLFICLGILALTNIFALKEVSALDGYKTVTHGLLDWYGNVNTETVNGTVYLPPKFAKFNVSGYGYSWLYREIRDQHGYKIHSYQPVKPASLSWPSSDGYTTNLGDRYNMPENKIWFGYPSDYTCVNSSGLSSNNVWSNFKTCGTKPNYYNYLTSSTKFTGRHSYSGTSGEYRYIGYSSDGIAITNPYMPSDYPINETPGTYAYKVILPPGTPANTLISSKFSKYSEAFDDSRDKVRYGYKIEAIKKLLNDTSNGMSKVSTDPNYWAQRLSLRNDPRYDTPIFLGIRNDNAYYIEIVGPSPVSMISDLIMQKISIYDDNGTANDYSDDIFISSAERNPTTGNITRVGDVTLENNRTYRVETKVYNDSVEKTKLVPALVDIQVLTDRNYSKYPIENGTWNTNKLPGGIPAKSTGTFNYTIFIPDTVGSNVAIHDRVNKSHFSYGDNIESSNDNLSLTFTVINGDGGDLEAVDSYLVDTNGNKVSYVIPGNEYYINYDVVYKGESQYAYTLKGYDSSTGSPIYEKKLKKFYIQGSGNYKTLAGFNEEVDVGFSKYATNDKGEIYVTLTDGEKLKFKSDKIFVSNPRIESTFKITTGGSINVNRRNDMFNFSYIDEYDIKVTNIEVCPKSFSPRDLTKVNAVVKYTINYTIPEKLKQHKPVILVTNTVIIDNKSYTFTDAVVPGDNTFVRAVELSYNVKDGIQPVITASIYANSDNKNYEYLKSNNHYLTNNRAISTKSNSILLSRPTNTLITTNENASFSESYREVKYNTTIKTYKYPGYNSRTYRFYTLTNLVNSVKNYNESYKILSVEFKSKLTEDKEMGDKKDGWIVLNDSTKGLIQSGYGFQLRITTEVTSNYSAPSITNPSGHSSTKVKNNSPADIIVKFNNKYYTATGIDSEPSFNVKTYIDGALSDNSKFTNKAKYVFETGTDKKIFTDKNLKNGDHTIEIYTPTINATSVGGSDIKLGSSRKYKITIQGSYLDDINPHLDN